MLQQTTLTLTPTWANKGLRVEGGPAVREKVVLRVVGAAVPDPADPNQFVAPDGLTVRVFPDRSGAHCYPFSQPAHLFKSEVISHKSEVISHKAEVLLTSDLSLMTSDYARFPLEETDAWAVDGNDLIGVIDFNTRSLAHVFRGRGALEVESAIIVVESGEADNLYAVGQLLIRNWRTDTGDPVPGSSWLRRAFDALAALFNGHAHKANTEDPTLRVDHNDLLNRGSMTHPQLEQGIGDAQGAADAAGQLAATANANATLALQGANEASQSLSLHTQDFANPHKVTAEQAGAATLTDVAGAVAAHNTNATAHEDIRNAAAYALSQHANNKANPHAVTLAQASAAQAAWPVTLGGKLLDPGNSKPLITADDVPACAGLKPGDILAGENVTVTRTPTTVTISVMGGAGAGGEWSIVPNDGVGSSYRIALPALPWVNGISVDAESDVIDNPNAYGGTRMWWHMKVEDNGDGTATMTYTSVIEFYGLGSPPSVVGEKTKVLPLPMTLSEIPLDGWDYTLRFTPGGGWCSEEIQSAIATHDADPAAHPSKADLDPADGMVKESQSRAVTFWFDFASNESASPGLPPPKPQPGDVVYQVPQGVFGRYLDSVNVEILGPPKAGVLYVNKVRQIILRWDGTALVPLSDNLMGVTKRGDWADSLRVLRVPPSPMLPYPDSYYRPVAVVDEIPDVSGHAQRDEVTPRNVWFFPTAGIPGLYQDVTQAVDWNSLMSTVAAFAHGASWNWTGSMSGINMVFKVNFIGRFGKISVRGIGSNPSQVTALGQMRDAVASAGVRWFLARPERLIAGGAMRKWSDVIADPACELTGVTVSPLYTEALTGCPRFDVVFSSDVASSGYSVFFGYSPQNLSWGAIGVANVFFE